MRIHHLFLLIAIVFATLAMPAFGAVPNDVETPGFTAPNIIPVGDPSIAVGDVVWRALDGKTYVVQASNGGGVVLADLKSPGFTPSITVQANDAVIKIPQAIVTLPGSGS